MWQGWSCCGRTSERPQEKRSRDWDLTIGAFGPRTMEWPGWDLDVMSPRCLQRGTSAVTIVKQSNLLVTTLPSLLHFIIIYYLNQEFSRFSGLSAHFIRKLDICALQIHRLDWIGFISNLWNGWSLPTKAGLWNDPGTRNKDRDKCYLLFNNKKESKRLEKKNTSLLTYSNLLIFLA